MCGIAGCIGTEDTATIERMLDALPHRGPNDRGIHTHGPFTFGHTRLSIIDVLKGHQPILANDGASGIICNGEIYNFNAIRRRLSTTYPFTTHSDSEVVLHLFQEKGPDCVRELDGMFAFAVYHQDQVMLARDPIGIKPLYYGFKEGHFYFSSELGAMSLSGVPVVHEFPCGHYYTPEQGFVRYYDVPVPRDFLLTDTDHAAALIRNALKHAVKKRLLADKSIHVGAFCSGGLDSSLIAALAAREIPHVH
ncbi:MAG: asparagine synthetase B, partial [Desulfatitalea sp.]|nr:asparagine synthetase B [Desulfatitalea sp.]